MTLRTSSFPETRASLLARIVDSGDQRSWEEFARLYRPMVYRLARKQGLQDADAEELVQEVMLAVARSIERWSPRPGSGGFRGWLASVTRNLSINFRTRRKLRPWGSGDSVLHCLLELQADAHSDLSSLFEIEYRRAVFQLAARSVREAVSERTWQAFWLSTIEAIPIAEVAQQFGMTAGNVYIARNRVMARLRREVRRLEADEASSLSTSECET